MSRAFMAGATALGCTPSTAAGFLFLLLAPTDELVMLPSRAVSGRAAPNRFQDKILGPGILEKIFEASFLQPMGLLGADGLDGTCGASLDTPCAFSAASLHSMTLQEATKDGPYRNWPGLWDKTEYQVFALLGDTLILPAHVSGSILLVDARDVPGSLPFLTVISPSDASVGVLWQLHFGLVSYSNRSSDGGGCGLLGYTVSSRFPALSFFGWVRLAAMAIVGLLGVVALVWLRTMFLMCFWMVSGSLTTVYHASGLASRWVSSRSARGLLFMMALFMILDTAQGVVCMSCHDGVAGCQGGETCPFFNLPFINGEILRGESGTHTTPGEGEGAAGVTHVLLLCAAVLPRSIGRFLTRGVLDFFKSVARRPAVGTPMAINEMTVEALIAAVQGGRVSPGEALSDILSRLATATQAEAARLNAISSTLSNMEKLHASATASGTASNGELWGAFTYAWTQAGRAVQHANTAVVVAGGAPDEGESGSTSTESRAIRQAKILRPRSEAEFFHMLHVWVMVCQAVGIGNALATGAFVEKVVHEQMASFQISWQQAHELFLVYLEAVETAPSGSPLTIANVYNSGGQDMYRERAIQRAKDHFKAPSGGGDIFRDKKQGSYIGQTSRGSPCVTFNLGKPNDQHPPTALDHTGRCKFAHKCDHYVTEQPDGTKGGICGSWKHCRAQCNNAKKSDVKVTG